MNRKTFFLCALAGFIGTIGVSAQETIYSKMSPSTRILLDLVAKKNTSNGQSRSIMSAGNLQVFVQVENKSGWDALSEAGCEIETRVDDMATALIPLSLVEKLSEHPGIRYIQAAEKVSLQMDSALRVSNVQPAHAGTKLSNPYTGKGVLIGVVDAEFDFKHPNFYDKSGKNYRIKQVWDQQRPEGEQKLTTQEEILAAGQSVSSKSVQHGTHVAGTAAGSGADTPYKGVAPESDLSLVAMEDMIFNTKVMDGVNYIFQQAEAAGKPCVVNLSLGENSGPHDGTGLVDLMIDKLVGPGKIAVIAAGNQRLKMEYVATLSPVDTLRTFIPKIYRHIQSEIVDVWADQPGEEFTYSLSLFDNVSREIIASTDFLSVKDSTIVLWSKDSTRKYVVAGMHQLYKNNGKHNMCFSFTYPQEAKGEECFLLGVATKKSPVRAWCKNSYFSDLNLGSPYKSGTGEYSIASPASAHRAISVGAYVSRDTTCNIFGQKKQVDGVYSELAKFSSIGPTTDNRIKPDVSAPGSSIYSSYNSVYMGVHGDSTKMVATSTFEGKIYPWGMGEGTSMACPFVTGSIALWLQANPTLTPEDIKKVLLRTSVKDKEMTYPNSFWGAGKIDVYKGLLDILNITSNKDVFADSPQEAVCVYVGQTPGSFHIRWANTPKAFSVDVHDMGGGLWYGEKVDDPVSVDYSVSIGNVPAGIYVITISTAEGVVTRKISFGQSVM